MFAGVAGRRHADAAFTAHAREDVPALLAEVGRLRAALQVCEHVLHRADPTVAEVHAAQQASGAWWTGWRPERVCDDLPDFKYRNEEDQ